MKPPHPSGGPPAHGGTLPAMANEADTFLDGRLVRYAWLSVAAAVLTHRLILRPESRLRKVTAESVVHELVADVPVPTIDAVPDEGPLPFPA